LYCCVPSGPPKENDGLAREAQSWPSCVMLHSRLELLRNAKAKGKRLGRPKAALDAKRITALRAQGLARGRNSYVLLRALLFLGHLARSDGFL
jgi:hypothetical protein